VSLPQDLPDGVLDIVVKVKDDIDLTTETAPITITKGAPCVSADSCANGQRCDQGRCLWDPPVGEVGDECTYQQFCKNELCSAVDGGGEARCTQACVQGIADSCPPDFTCVESSDLNGGLCWPSSEVDQGGCCSANSELPASGMLFGLGVLGLMFRRRRR
jgi:MYXO-CTERM domain-containing protein